MDIKKILKFGILAGVFILPFIPLIVSSSLFFPFITGKNFTFRIIVEIIFGLWLVLAYLDPQYRLKRSPLLWSVLAVIGILSISTIFAVNSYKAFWSNFERMDGLISHLHLFLYFLVTASVLTKEKIWGWLFGTSLFASFLVAIYAFAQMFGMVATHQSATRLDATLGNSTYLAIYMLFHIFLSAYVIFRNQTNKLLGYSLGVLMAIQLVVLYYTATRGALLGLLGGLILGAVIVAIIGHGRSRKISFWGLGIILILVAGFFVAKDTAFVRQSSVLSRFASISLTEATTQSRFLIWRMSAKGFLESPKTILIGWGLENYNFVFNKYYVPAMWRQEPWFDRSHDIFFDWLISAGALGLLAYLSLFVSALWIIWRGRPNEEILGKAMLTGLFAAYLFNNVFVFDNIVSYLLFFSVLAYLHSHYLEDKTVPVSGVRVPLKKLEEKPYWPLIATSVFLLVCFSIYYFNIQPIKTANDLVYAISARGQNAGAESYGLFQQIFKDNTFGKVEAREQLMQYALAVARVQNTPPDLRQKFLVLAYRQGASQVGESIPDPVTGKSLPGNLAASPSDARYRLFFGSFLSAVGHFDEALVQLNKAHELSPNKQTIFFEIGNVFLNKGDTKSALDWFRRAYELDHTYSEAANLYSLLLLANNQQSEADKVQRETFGQKAYSDSRLAGALQRIKAGQPLF